MSPSSGARDDPALVAAILAGDDHAFSELMRRHKDGLYRFVRHYVGDAEEAYDLLQETFVAAWSALGRLDPKRPVAAWLRGIALNKCRDWSRRRNVRQFFFRARDLDAAAAQVAATSADDAGEFELSRLDAAIAALPEALKEPLLLTQIEGLSHKDAARVLKLSPKAVEVRVYRAKRALEAALRQT